MGELGVGFKLFGTIIMAEERQAKAVAEEEQECNSMITKEGGTPEKEEATMGPEAALACPRCKSQDTKFCYFNNYNVNQPRHFCRGCHRYWTAGGTLRNVPIGTGRRSRRPAARSGSTTTPCIIEYSSPCFDAGVAMEKWILPHGRTGGGFPGRLR